jgi:HK97 family phage prohead protease
VRDLLTRSLGEAADVFDLDVLRRASLTVTTRTRSGMALVEARYTTSPIELRDDEGGYWVSGYDATFDVAYPVAGGPEHGGWMETIARSAFTKSLQENEDVRLLINHKGLPIARTKSGTLTIRTDDLGRFIDARNLDPANPRVQEAVSALRRGDVDQMSHAFMVVRQEWSKDYSERRILEVRSFDSSIVTYPANDATIVGLRSQSDHAKPAMPLALALAQAEALAL